MRTLMKKLKNWVAGIIHGDNSVLRDLLCCHHGESRWCSGYHACPGTPLTNFNDGGWGSDRGSYFIPKKITTSEFVYPKKSLLSLAYPKKSLGPFFATQKNPSFFFATQKNPGVFHRPKKITLGQNFRPKKITRTNFFGRVRRKEKKMPIYLYVQFL